MKYINLLFLPLLLFGCAAALVSESNSPREKLKQAQSLFYNSGRPQGAITLLKQALALPNIDDDKLIEADIYRFLGDIYRVPGPRGSQLQNYSKSISHYIKAANIYHEIKYHKNQSLMYWVAHISYLSLKNKRGVCKMLRNAQNSYYKKSRDSIDNFLPQFRNGHLIANINHYLNKECK